MHLPDGENARASHLWMFPNMSLFPFMSKGGKVMYCSKTVQTQKLGDQAALRPLTPRCWVCRDKMVQWFRARWVRRAQYGRKVPAACAS